MSSRISIARPQAGGYSPDPHGIGNSRPSATGYRAANPENPIEQLQYYAKQIEDYVEIYSQPLRPYLPAIGRFLIIVTFLEDSLRIVTQWGDQLWYLQKYVSCSVLFWTPLHITFSPLVDTGISPEEFLTFSSLLMSSYVPLLHPIRAITNRCSSRPCSLAPALL
jgi:hypothetical protein